MKYCPKCRGEYQDWVEKFMDCGEKLAGTLPLEKPEPEDESRIITKGNRQYKAEPLTVVASFASALEAQFSKGILESEGIESIITNADNVILSGRNTSTVTGISLAVKESDVKKAKEILESIQKDISEADFNEDGSLKDAIPEEENPESTQPGI